MKGAKAQEGKALDVTVNRLSAQGINVALLTLFGGHPKLTLKRFSEMPQMAVANRIGNF